MTTSDMFAPLTVRGKGQGVSGKDRQEVRENLARGKEFPCRFAFYPMFLLFYSSRFALSSCPFALSSHIPLCSYPYFYTLGYPFDLLMKFIIFRLKISHFHRRSVVVSISIIFIASKTKSIETSSNRDLLAIFKNW